MSVFKYFFFAPRTTSLYERKMTEGQMIKKIYLRSVLFKSSEKSLKLMLLLL